MIALELMNRAVWILVGCVLLVSVIAVFAAPAVDLQPTAMRAARAASLALAALVAIVAVSILLGPQTVLLAPVPSSGASWIPRRSIDPLDVFCIRLC